MSPDSERQPFSSMDTLPAAPDAQPGAAGHIPWSSVRPRLPAALPLALTSSSAGKAPCMNALRCRGDFHLFPVGAAISQWDRGTNSVRQPSSASRQPVLQQKGDDAATQPLARCCLLLSPTGSQLNRPTKPRWAPQPGDRDCVPRHTIQPHQPSRRTV